MTITCPNPEAVARRAFYLAYGAAHAAGMGFLQAREGVTEDQVWQNVRTRADYVPTEPKPGEAHADYVFGRMMKLSIRWDETTITVNDSTPRYDYQSWCGKYPTYESLIQSAIAEVR